MMITPVGQRSTHSPHRVQTSSSITNTTWSSGSTPGWSVSTASAMVSAPSMWMHFHGQMSTQPSHMMHSDWSMWRNCLGLTALPRSSGAISVSTYSPGNDGMGGLASVRAIAASDLPYQRAAVCRCLDRRGGRRLLPPVLPPEPHVDLEQPEDDVEGRGDDVADHLLADDDAAPPEERDAVAEDDVVLVAKEVEGTDRDADRVGPPLELAVGPPQPAVGYHAVDHQQDGEDEGGADECLAPRRGRAGLPSVPDEEHDSDHHAKHDQ